MSAPHTISKGLTKPQYRAFEEARTKSGLTMSQAKDMALRLFCESQGVKWPATQQHGGSRNPKIDTPNADK